MSSKYLGASSNKVGVTYLNETIPVSFSFISTVKAASMNSPRWARIKAVMMILLLNRISILVAVVQANFEIRVYTSKFLCWAVSVDFRTSLRRKEALTKLVLVCAASFKIFSRREIWLLCAVAKNKTQTTGA